MPFSKWFNNLFIEQDNRSEKWDDDLFEYGKLEDETKLYQHLDSANELYLDNRQIYTAINTFTLETETKEEKMRLLDRLKNEKFIEDIRIKESAVLIKTIKGDIKIYKLSDLIPQIKEDYPDVVTQDRKGKCHEKAIMIADRLESVSSEVVTGYIFGYSDKSKYLHSWIELNHNGKDMIIDYTLNAMINKEGYYQIQNAIPLSRISSVKIKEDVDVLNKLKQLGKLDIKEYLLFRDEIINDYEKNKKVFEKEER